MKAPQPLFSFLILTWNRCNLLSNCLDSLLKNAKYLQQSEVIVLDNGSTDGTRTLLEGYAGNPLIQAIYRDKNYGLNSYKLLLGAARGKYMVVIDEDVIEFPFEFDQAFLRYTETFPDYGYLSLDVVQNEHTNGAKPSDNHYREEVRNGLTVQRGPAGGWCACFQRKHFSRVKWLFNLINLSMRRGDDGALCFLFRNLLRLKHGVIKGIKCFHACGPYYAKHYGFLDLQILKFENTGLTHIQDMYKKYRD